MTNYLVAGGAGFIGSNLCLRLLNDGHQVIGLDNLSTGSQGNIDELRQQANFKFLKADVTALPAIPEPIEAIFHLASPASPIDFSSKSLEILRANSFGTEQLLKLASVKKAKFLFASTSEVYGNPSEHPQRESYWGCVNPIGPRSCYDESKRFAESYITNFGRIHKQSYAIVRIFNTYGPRMRPNDGRLVSNLVIQALKQQDITVYGDGSQTRCLCYVDDLVEGLICAMKNQYPEPINLGSQEEYPIIEIAKKIVQLTRSPSKIVHRPLPPDDPKLRQPDLKRAHEILNWQPKFSLEDGLKKTIDYFIRTDSQQNTK